MDCSNVYTEEQLAPLFGMLGKLQRLVDDQIHLQQAAGTTKVGYNAYYDHKLSQINRLANYSGTRANKEFWAHDQTDTEKEILKIKAHEKQLSLVSQSKGQSGSATARSAGGDGTPQSKSARSRHNKRQRELYQKQKKAWKVQQGKQAEAAKALGAAGK